MKASNKNTKMNNTNAVSTVNPTDGRQSKVTKTIRQTLQYDGAIYSDERSEGRRYKLANPMTDMSVRTKKAKVAKLNTTFATKRIKAEAYLHQSENAWNNTICVATF